MKQVKYICCFCEDTTKLRESEKDNKENTRFWNVYIVYLVLPEAKSPLALYKLFLIGNYKKKLEFFLFLGGEGDFLPVP